MSCTKLDKSNRFLSINPHHEYEKPIVYNLWGQYYEKLNQFDSAISYYQKGLNHSEKFNIHSETVYSLEGLTRVYDSINDSENKSKYLEALLKIKDSTTVSISNKEKEATKYMLENEIRKLTSSSTKIYYILAIITLVVILLSYFMLKRKSKTIKSHSEELHLKEIENDNLKQKVNSQASELIELAKSDRELFLIRFKEVYGDFLNKLILKHDKLTDKDIELIAYLCFDFSSKEIASYTLVTHRTVQSKKYRLRKKLKLNSKYEFKSYFVLLGFQY